MNPCKSHCLLYFSQCEYTKQRGKVIFPWVPDFGYFNTCLPRVRLDWFYCCGENWYAHAVTHTQNCGIKTSTYRYSKSKLCTRRPNAGRGLRPAAHWFFNCMWVELGFYLSVELPYPTSVDPKRWSRVSLLIISLLQSWYLAVPRDTQKKKNTSIFFFSSSTYMRNHYLFVLRCIRSIRTVTECDLS